MYFQLLFLVKLPVPGAAGSLSLPMAGAAGTSSDSPGRDPDPASRQLLHPGQMRGERSAARALRELGSSSSREGRAAPPRGAFRAGLRTRSLIRAVDTHG